MSKQALDTFNAKLAQDESLRSELARVLSQDGERTTASAEAVVAFARSRGYDVSVEDLRATSELNDEQLEHVAGGALIFLKYGERIKQE